VEGTGRNGLVTKGDVLQVVKKGDGARQAGAEEHAAGKAGQPAREAAAPETGEVEYREQTQPREPAGRRQPSEEMPERREQLSRMKKRMAENLLQAVQSSAHVTTFNEIDLSRVITLRREYGDEFSERHGTRLGFMSFFVKASCAALFEYPVINASIDEDVIVYHQYANVGIAVSTERGLVVPVIRNAHDKSFARIESEIRSFASRAADKKLTIDELTGGTFSITNGGVFGSLLSTPIPNPPQMAILGMHAITNRPVAVGDQVAVRPMMYVALTYDHRYVEGREAVSFLKRVKVLLEDPQRLLIEV
jgi:2-oxoglutarate dehydrogenase E2 component (dihydrolipoamide succinyltransferase)